MVAQGRIMGVLTLYNKKHEDGFTEEDQRLVAILAGQSAQVVENARLYQEEQELLRVQEELRLAFQIQITLLPSTTPTLDGYDIAGTSIPAQSVGGDYFDFIPVSDNRLGLCVGDVAGKGLPAAMLMANIQATVRSLALTGDPVSLLLERSNRLLCQRLQKHMFVTLFYGELDAVTHRFVYANAGHNRPYLIRAGALTLRPGGLRPRIESAALDATDPPSPARVHDWVRQNIHIEGRPEWVFVKVHTHGAPERNADALLGAAAISMHETLAPRQGSIVP
jgi:hypothetical protein